MREFNELHIKTLFATAGVPVTTKVGTDPNPPVVLTAIYLPPDVSVVGPSPYNDAKSYPDGVFVVSSIEPAVNPYNFHAENGFSVISFVDSATFEKCFDLSDSRGRRVNGNIDRAEWTSRTVAAAKRLREAGFSTMPMITDSSVPSLPPSAARPLTKEYG